MLKFLPSILTALVMLVGVFSGPLQGMVAQNPTLVIVLTSLCQILMHLTPSPLVKK